MPLYLYKTSYQAQALIRAICIATNIHIVGEGRNMLDQKLIESRMDLWVGVVYGNSKGEME